MRIKYESLASDGAHNIKMHFILCATPSMEMASETFTNKKKQKQI